MSEPRPGPLPIVWSIAGSDSGAGAGIQADLRAFDTFDVHGCTAVAAITAQNSVGVQRVEAVDTAWLDAQLASLASDLAPRAIKTGLLGSVQNVRCVVEWVDRLRRERPLALVVDPVWRASTGDELSSAALRDVLRGELLPRATAITPNRAEAAWLLGWDAAELADPDVVERAAAALRALGPSAVVITGGDAAGAVSLDRLHAPQAQGWLGLARVDTRDHHGSGCVYAASMAAALALEFCTADAAVIAKMSATASLRAPSVAGRGAGAVRPQSGFGLDATLLPSLRTRANGTSGDFVPLREPRLGLYAVVDSAAWVERVLAGGVRTVQLRVKHAHPDLLHAEVARAVHAARQADAQLFVNDHWQLAIEHGAYGVHLGQMDLPGADLQALRAAGVRLGVSTHSLWEVCRAVALAPSYVACGPVHPTTTKDMPWRPQGPDNLAYWCALLRLPVVGIGGMDIARSAQAVRCGAAGVAVVRGITEAASPEAAIRDFAATMAAASSAPRWPAPRLPRSTLVEPAGPGRQAP